MKLHDQFKRIYEEVEQLTFSEVNTLQLMKYANEACRLAGRKEALSFTSFILPEIAKIKDVQILPLLGKNIFAKEKRQRFYDSKKSLKLNLEQCFN